MVISYWAIVPLIVYNKSRLLIVTVITVRIQNYQLTSRDPWQHLRHPTKIKRCALRNPYSLHVMWLHHGAPSLIRQM